jgi:hypothetical protein
MLADLMNLLLQNLSVKEESLGLLVFIKCEDKTKKSLWFELPVGFRRQVYFESLFWFFSSNTLPTKFK